MLNKYAISLNEYHRPSPFSNGIFLSEFRKGIGMLIEHQDWILEQSGPDINRETECQKMTIQYLKCGFKSQEKNFFSKEIKLSYPS